MAYGKKPSPLKLFGSRRRKREQRAANRAFDQQMQAYSDFDVSQNLYADFQNVYAGAENVYAGAENVYADAQNVYAGAENVYEGMENMYEDIRIDTTAAELAGSQFAQSQADQLAALGASAGGSGFGALTTTMGRQAAQQAAANTADVRRQAIERERLIAGEASRIQSAERAGAAAQQQMILSGADAQQQMMLAGADRQQQMILGGADAQQQMILGGAAQQQQMIFGGAADAFNRELAREQEMLGFAAGRKTAADQARLQNTQMWMNLAGSVAQTAGNIATAGTSSIAGAALGM